MNVNLDIRPISAKGTHPIETGHYNIPTQAILNLYVEVSQWITNRSPGGIVHGRPRIGKTSAIKFMNAFIGEEFGEKTPVYHICCNQYRYPSEQTFFGDLLQGVGHNIYLSGKADAKRDRLIKYLVEIVRASGKYRVIFFMDDAQRLHELHYGWLMDISNLLEQQNIHLTVILVGQEELVFQRTAFMQAGKSQIVGRFMVHDYKFSGVASIEDMRACLECYDSNSEYPEGSNWSFTRFYFPDSFNNGFRLSQCADALYEQFLLLNEKSNNRVSLEIPMQYLTLTINHCLRTYGVDGIGVEFPAPAHWKDSIEKSGYIDAELYRTLV